MSGPRTTTAPGRSSISGENDAVEECCAEAESLGARRAIRLKVSGAFHSPLVARAADRLKPAIDRIRFADPVAPFMSTVTAKIEPAQRLASLLVDQLTAPVRFTQAAGELVKDGVTTFVEIGPGNVLSGLVKRIDRGVRTISVNDLASLEKAKEALASSMTRSPRSRGRSRSSPAAPAASAARSRSSSAAQAPRSSSATGRAATRPRPSPPRSGAAPSRPTSRDPESAKALVEAAGDVDVLVNNAGLTRDGVLARMSDDDWRTVIDTNLSSVFYTCRAAARPMMKRRAGAIVNISSIVGVHGNWGQTNYAASKAGIIGFTKSLARELGSRNVRANVVAPGYVKTQLTDVLPEEATQTMLANTPLGRLGDPEDVAGAVRFLCSDEAAFVTGAVLLVDGGLGM